MFLRPMRNLRFSPYHLKGASASLRNRTRSSAVVLCERPGPSA